MLALWDCDFITSQFNIVDITNECTSYKIRNKYSGALLYV